MIWIEALGYIAAACTLATYSMKTMIPLRISGIIANCFFIAFGFFGAIYPTLILHVILLPLNAVRLYQMLQLVRRVREASEGDLSMDWLKPFMTRRACKNGDILFHKGDIADRLFYVVTGRFRLNEIAIDIGHGQVIGELGLLAPGNRRTQTCECVEAGEALVISYDSVRQLFFQNPTFGFYFMRLATQRLFSDVGRLERALEERRPPGNGAELKPAT
jgi:CRP/FNR family transcriptional regulator, cyclic AMP receptor protein